jgi:[protein-PII] uridylyltransferase
MAPRLTPEVLQTLRQRLRDGKAAIQRDMAALRLSSRMVQVHLRALAHVADQVLCDLWQQADLPPAVSLLAVGGYGRAELFPCSDVDLLVLLPEGTVLEQDAGLKERVEAFIGACWDIGLEIAPSVRTPQECLDEAAKDLTVQTALLECRLLQGNAAAFAHLVARLQAALDPHAFFMGKSLELRQRHHKHEDTPYALEPNCKESPGGLRDLQTILWVAKAAGLGSSWDELARKGLATAHEARRIKVNEALLSLLRARLHLLAHRREDRLVFDVQTGLAQSFGLTCSQQGRRPSEMLMRRYYWAAKAVTQLSQIFLLNIRDQLQAQTAHVPAAMRAINARFLDKDGMLEVASDDLYTEQPHAILETFLLYQRTLGIKGLSTRTLRALYNARPLMNASFRSDPANRATFLQILQYPDGVTHALRLMNQTSVLGRYLWVFRHIVGQMQHDLFHVYTVDQHILMVLRNVRCFFIPEHSHEYPFCSQLAAGWTRPWVLYVAALFHDIAKGRGGDHSALGASDVRVFCQEHGIGDEDTELIVFLVSEHLTMSSVAQKQDLSDPEVITAFAAKVRNERYLTGLYLLTVADIRGTGPKVWSAWKGRLLEDLYRYTLRVLGGHAPDPDTVIEARKRDALKMLALHALPHLAHEKLWSQLDVGYFTRHPADEIAWHTRQLSRWLAGKHSLRSAVPASTTVVRARLSPDIEGLQVLVYAPDQDDLFARICGYFDHAGFSILDAKIHTTLEGNALDTFQVVTATLSDHYRELIGLVESELTRTVEERGPLPAPRRSGRPSRRVKSFPITPRVDLQPDERKQRWVLTISACDRPGLLYGIAHVLARHRIHLQLAKVVTLGERVEDTFLISSPALHHDKTQLAIETELLQVVA